MNTPSFFKGVLVALLFSAAGAVAYAGLGWLVSSTWALKAVIAGLSLAWLIHLLGHSEEKIGRWVTLLAWAATAGLTAWAQWPLSGVLIAHVGLLWGVRCLYQHGSFLHAAADLVLHAAALSAAAWAAGQTHSLFWTLWSFFLVLALAAFFPSGRAPARRQVPIDRFEHAHRQAEAALRRLSAS